MYKISVIIPVYNVEKYLPRCLDSVINQTYRNLEIICVNDCSTDNSLDVIKEYEKKDERIKLIIRKQNGGLSAARNTGLNNATGEYLYFLDSDDWIDLDYIEQMLKIANKENTDIIQNLNIEEIFENGSAKKYPLQINKTGFIDSVIALNKTPVMAVMHLFRTDFIKKYNLKFPEGFIHEDIYFHHITKSKTNKIFIFKGSNYHYFQRNNSTIYARKSKIIPIIKITKKIIEYYSTNDIKDKKQISILNFSDISEIKTEEEFAALKTFLPKLVDYYDTLGYKYNGFEKFVIDALGYASDFQSFNSAYKTDLKFSYLRHSMKKDIK